MLQTQRFALSVQAALRAFGFRPRKLREAAGTSLYHCRRDAPAEIPSRSLNRAPSHLGIYDRPGHATAYGETEISVVPLPPYSATSLALGI
jgi:hypothetical protein